MGERDIGQEVLESIQAIQSGEIGRVTVFTSPEDITKVRGRRKPDGKRSRSLRLRRRKRTPD